MRRCESCHDAESTHDWLPYSEAHMQAVNCETCHVPQIYASAVQQVDWTVLQADGEPVTSCRGLEAGSGGQSDGVSALVTGYQPALLPRDNLDSAASIAPYNLATAWYWVAGDPPRPVRLLDLQAAWLEGEDYHPDVLAAFDQDGDASLSQAELRIDNPEKEALIAGRLQALGLEEPRIVGEVQPYSINHNVTDGEWAVRDCQTCHSDESRLSQPFMLAAYTPGGVMPEFVADSNAMADGQITQAEDGSLYYQPEDGAGELYVLGLSNVNWIDLLGGLMFLGVLGVIGVHATLRLVNARRHPHSAPEMEQVYMYSFYERLWHWLQTFAIILLLFTGLVIHDPDTFGIFSFRGVVVVHNVLAVLLVINAFLSLFYHLASGEIRQYIPRPRGFFDDAIVQAKYYIRGIFKGEGHPFEKTPGKKLNPLQQVTYFGILNVLLPLQIITGIFMWGVSRWPDIANALGGLPFLAPFHTLIAWTFASFIVAHVYLTTTGPEPLTGIKAMMMGWEDVEASPSAGEAALPAQEVTEA
jgi:thiosulfate reductase cytochrome b subunit